jgi:RimJ/RimL family protein N-acetyltransferase
VYNDAKADIAYTIFEKLWRRGYASEACRLMIERLAEDYSVTVIEALVDTRNIASIALLTKLAFSRVEVIPRADYFKGEVSDEYRYRLDLRLTQKL